MRRTKVCAFVFGASVVPLASALVKADPTPLYRWSFNSPPNTVTGTTVTPDITPNGLASDGGVLTMAKANGSNPLVLTPASLYSTSGAGVTGAASDYAIDNSLSASNNTNPGGIVYSSGATDPNNANTINALPNLTQYTLTGWVKPTTAELTQQSRIMMLGGTQAFDNTANTNGVYIYLNAGKVEYGARSTASNGTVTAASGTISFDSGAVGTTLVANVWNFIAVEADLNTTNTFFDPNTQAAVGRNDNTQLYQYDTSTDIGTFTSQNGYKSSDETGNASDVPITFGGNQNYGLFLNRASDTRAFQGLGDDFQVYNSFLTTAQIQNLILSDDPGAVVVPEPTVLSGMAMVAGSAFLRRRRRPTC